MDRIFPACFWLVWFLVQLNNGKAFENNSASTSLPLDLLVDRSVANWTLLDQIINQFYEVIWFSYHNYHDCVIIFIIPEPKVGDIL